MYNRYLDKHCNVPIRQEKLLGISRALNSHRYGIVLRPSIFSQYGKELSVSNERGVSGDMSLSNV